MPEERDLLRHSAARLRFKLRSRARSAIGL